MLLRALVAAAVLALVHPATVHGQGTPPLDPPLRGLTAVKVAVVDLDASGSYPLDPELRLQLERDLTRAGVPLSDTAAAVLKLTVSHRPTTDNQQAWYTYELELQERVSIVRNPAAGVFLARTWFDAGRGVASKGRVESAVRDGTREATQKFLNELRVASAPR